ncbi:MAG: hypothetical protein EVA89_13135 [Sandaracinaceae bacterium]|nr:MAG: hypothetical protein EVA89_13135 [Sandaracinaceae bacterium]
MARQAPPAPTRKQYRLARLITRWYLEVHHGRPSDVGAAAMFCDPARVGHFAVSREALAAGDPDALFRVLFMTTMFQRRSDAQIMRVLRGIGAEDARELSSARTLLDLAEGSPCPHLASNEALIRDCDLTKHPTTKLGICAERPELACHLKRQTVLLKRYGHFGKVPTSAALNIRDAGASDLSSLRAQVLAETQDPAERASLLQRRLMGAWRVSEKIASMFLSVISNPQLSPGLAPWSEGVDWSRYVVVDSNVDLFLRASGYEGPWTYEARAQFIRRLSKRIPIEGEGGAAEYNPRLVQQALYLFMSVSNRRDAENDCRYVESCSPCRHKLGALCPATSTASAP